jgi:hypothetical protein
MSGNDHSDRGKRCAAKERGRRSLLPAALTIALLATGAVAPRALAVSPDLLPDLVADPPMHPQPAQPAVLSDGQSHLLIRFNGLLHNIGPGPLEIRGSNPVNGTMSVSGQRIYRQDSSHYDDNSRNPPIHFEDTDGHNHWHLMGAARFSLWNQAGTAELVPASKVGFCLEDGEPVDIFAPPAPAYSQAQIQRCKEGQPDAGSIFEGISPGWQDVYGANLPFQWIDVSDVAPGLYRLGAQMDPNDFVREVSETNNGPTLAAFNVAVPGYVASSRKVRVSKARRITLPARQYGTPGPRRFKIESAPRHGRLSTKTGAYVTGARVRYRPRRGFRGRDSFSFSARDPLSAFPRRAVAGTVSVRVTRGNLLVVRGLHFGLQGAVLAVRGRANRSGVLRIRIMKAGRRLGSCRTRSRANRRFKCSVELRSSASVGGAKAIVSLRPRRGPKAVRTYRVPRRLGNR